MSEPWTFFFRQSSHKLPRFSKSTWNLSSPKGELKAGREMRNVFKKKNDSHLSQDLQGVSSVPARGPGPSNCLRARQRPHVGGTKFSFHFVLLLFSSEKSGEGIPVLLSLVS